MFFRTKHSGTRSYLQIVENRWEDGRPRQRVIATLGRLDPLQQSGQLDGLLLSGARLSRNVLLLSAHISGEKARKLELFDLATKKKIREFQVGSYD